MTSSPFLPTLRRALTAGLASCGWAAALAAQAAQPSPAVAKARQLVSEGQFAAAESLLTPVVAETPGDGQAWLVLGTARQKQGKGDEAAQAFRHALESPTRRPAVLAMFRLLAERGPADSAAVWLDSLRRYGFDLTMVASSPEIARLHDDPRFADLFPDRIRFQPPFVEGVRVIHEWRGEKPGDEFGWIARGVGDVDQDRVEDVVISATSNPPFGDTTGAVYVYSGRSGKRLWRVQGEPKSVLGTGLEAAGDVNADGVPDVVAGAPGINSVLVLSGRDGRELLRLRGDSADHDLGQAASGIGDFNRDGHAEIIASAPSSDAGGKGAGRVYVFSGKDGRRLLTLDGERPGDGYGSTVGGGGGRYFIVGAGTAGPNNRGRVYVYDRLARKPRFIKDADESGAALGAMFVSVVGDVNADGTPDVYAADFANSAKGPFTGRAYVYSGRNGEPILTLTGDAAGEGFGIGAARVGDVDRDGRADVIAGSWQHGSAAWSGGRVVVHSGKDGSVLWKITGRVPGETLGFDAVGVGDMNGDGTRDYLVTSAWSMVNGLRSGRVFVVSGVPAPR